jgi:hypothetical protein
VVWVISIVGDADGGKMLSESEYEEFKKRTAIGRGPNRLYVSWTNINTNMECRLIGPQSKCNGMPNHGLNSDATVWVWHDGCIDRLLYPSI